MCSLTKGDASSKVALLYYRIWSLNSEQLNTYQDNARFILNREHEEEGDDWKPRGQDTLMSHYEGLPPGMVLWCSTSR